MLRSACRSRSMKLMSSRPSGSTVRNCESCGTASLTPDVPAAGARATGRGGGRAAPDTPTYGVERRAAPTQGATNDIHLMEPGHTMAHQLLSEHAEEQVG